MNLFVFSGQIWLCSWCFGAQGKSLEIRREVSRKRERCYNKSDILLGGYTGAVFTQKAMGYPQKSTVYCGEAIRPFQPFPALWCEAHRLRFPGRKGRSVLCVPQKNGNRDFSLLIYFLHYGTIPDNESAMVSTLKQQRISFSTVDRFDDARGHVCKLDKFSTY